MSDLLVNMCGQIYIVPLTRVILFKTLDLVYAFCPSAPRRLLHRKINIG